MAAQPMGDEYYFIILVLIIHNFIILFYINTSTFSLFLYLFREKTHNKNKSTDFDDLFVKQPVLGQINAFRV